MPRAEMTMPERVVPRLVATVGQDHGDFSRGGESVENIAGEGEGAVQVGCAGRLQIIQGGVDGGGFAGMRGSQQEARPAIEGHQRDGLDVAACGGQLREKPGGRDTEPQRIRRAHAVRIVQEQRNVHAARLAVDRGRESDDGGLGCFATSDQQVEAAVQILRPSAGEKNPAPALAPLNDGLWLQGSKSGRRIHRRQLHREAVRRAAFRVGQPDEPAILARRNVVGGRKPAGQQTGKRKQPKRTWGGAHGAYSSVWKVATETWRTAVRSQRLSTLTKSACRARRSHRMMTASLGLRWMLSLSSASSSLSE